MVQKDTKPNNQSKYLSDSDYDDNKIDLRLKASIEERQYNTIPGLAIATQIALNHSRAQANPTMERGPPQDRKLRLRNQLQTIKRWKLLALPTKTNSDQLL